MTGPRRAEALIGAALVAGAACTWGTWSLFVRHSGAGSLAAAALPLWLMGLFALPLVWVQRRRVVWDRRTVLRVLWLGALAGSNLLTFFWALQITSVAVATLCHYAAPLLIAVLAPRFDGERVPRAPAAALLGLAGLTLLLLPGIGAGAPSSTLTGALLGLASAVSYALLVFSVRGLEPVIGGARVIAYQGLCAGAILTPLALPQLLELDLRGAVILGAGALVPGTLAGLAFVAGLRRIGSSRAAILTFCEPATAVLVGTLAWQERLSPFAGIGAALILAAGLWVSRPTRTLADIEAAVP